MTRRQWRRRRGARRRTDHRKSDLAPAGVDEPVEAQAHTEEVGGREIRVGCERRRRLEGAVRVGRHREAGAEIPTLVEHEQVRVRCNERAPERERHRRFRIRDRQARVRDFDQRRRNGEGTSRNRRGRLCTERHDRAGREDRHEKHGRESDPAGATAVRHILPFVRHRPTVPPHCPGPDLASATTGCPAPCRFDVYIARSALATSASRSSSSAMATPVLARRHTESAPTSIGCITENEMRSATATISGR